jgi:hypothetical protein
MCYIGDKCILQAKRWVLNFCLLPNHLQPIITTSKQRSYLETCAHSSSKRTSPTVKNQKAGSINNKSCSLGGYMKEATQRRSQPTSETPFILEKKTPGRVPHRQSVS